MTSIIYVGMDIHTGLTAAEVKHSLTTELSAISDSIEHAHVIRAVTVRINNLFIVRQIHRHCIVITALDIGTHSSPFEKAVVRN